MTTPGSGYLTISRSTAAVSGSPSGFDARYPRTGRSSTGVAGAWSKLASLASRSGLSRSIGLASSALGQRFHHGPTLSRAQAQPGCDFISRAEAADTKRIGTQCAGPDARCFDVRLGSRRGSHLISRRGPRPGHPRSLPAPQSGPGAGQTAALRWVQSSADHRERRRPAQAGERPAT